MHDRWEGLSPSPLLVGHIPAEQISNTQALKKCIGLPSYAIGNVTVKNSASSNLALQL